MGTPREILFRAKRKDNGEWVEGMLFYQRVYLGIEFDIDEENQCDWRLAIQRLEKSYEIDPITLSQFTGMYDKNGKCIFENDIVKTQYGRLCVVKWYNSDSYCGWDLDPINTNDNLELKPPSEYFLYNEECNEIVGNAFDNYVL